MDKNSAWIKDHELRGKKGSLLLLYIQPGASKTGIKGVFGAEPMRLKVGIQAPPVDGAANEAVLEWLAETLAISQSKIFIVSGQLSRNKNIWIEGMTRSLVLDSLK